MILHIHCYMNLMNLDYNNYIEQGSKNNCFLNYITTLSGNVNAYLISLSGKINDLYYNKNPFNGITNWYIIIL